MIPKATIPLLAALALAPLLLGQSTCEPEQDVDGDGYTTSEGDCDDSNPTVNPEGIEICGDGLDQDCDGQDDVCLTDDDGDGWAEERGDCDDNDAEVNPGAQELCGDGVDQDCDGIDPACSQDNDGDGFSVGDGDCDDGNPAVYPGGNDLCDDNLDQDCSGSPLVSLTKVQAEVFSPYCTSCHGEVSQGGLDLRPQSTFDQTVRVASGDVPSMYRIKPGDPDNSYLMHKLWGTHKDVGGSGSQMPKGQSNINEQDILLVQHWASSGALETCP